MAGINVKGCGVCVWNYEDPMEDSSDRNKIDEIRECQSSVVDVVLRITQLVTGDW